jgi:hypothetical protein
MSMLPFSLAVLSFQPLYSCSYGGSMAEVMFPNSSEPFINWKHIDGPLLILRNGELHWLTWIDRFQLYFRLTNIYKLERKYWNDRSL